MPNILDANGLQTATQSELVAQFIADFQAIYGNDINLDQDTPDGQLMMIIIQSILDLEDLLTQVYNSFDPDLAIGKVLDQRVSLNGIQRQVGTYTTTDIEVVASAPCNLDGVDLQPDNPYTVKDNAGNEFVLLNSQTISGAGTYTYLFRAKNPGEVLTVPNTITQPVTIVLGIDSVNNPNAATSTGINEETDAQLRIRRLKSVSLPSQGYLSGLYALLNNLSNVNYAKVYENVTNVTDVDGIPGHSIWVIVDGGDPAEIADAIYRKRNAGCGMKGLQSYNISQVDGSLFPVFWDNVITETLYIAFDATSIDGINAPNIDYIRTNLPSLIPIDVYSTLNINQISAAVQQLDPNSLVTNAGFSLSPTGPFTNTLQNTAKNYVFSLVSANIIITPMIMVPPTATVASGGATLQLAAYGGFGSYTWTMFSGAGSVSPTGLYTSAGVGTDVVRATDSQGNFADCTVTVI